MYHEKWTACDHTVPFCKTKVKLWIRFIESLLLILVANVCPKFNWVTWGNITLAHSSCLLLMQYSVSLSAGDVVSPTDWNRPICQAFRVYPALKPWLNCALYCEWGCLSEVKKCCSKSILLFLVAAAQISGCCQPLTNRLYVLSALVISPSHCMGKINLGN